MLATRPMLRWLVPAGVLAAVGGVGAMTAALRADAGASLPARSAQQLLVELAAASPDGVSGTMLERADLGLPRLPSGVGGDGSAEFASLIDGTHTLRVWSGGPGQTRIALLGALGESDVIHNGTDMWIWSSTDNSATHARVAGDPGAHPPVTVPRTPATALPTTPQEAAAAVLAAVDPSTAVTVGANTTVAGRAAYQLVFAPRDPASLVSAAWIAIDGERHVPLRVQVYAKGYPTKPAFEIGFSQVSFRRPDAAMFRFNPPPGTAVHEISVGTPAARTPTADAVIGTGWTSVLATRLPAATIPPGSGGRTSSSLEALINQLPQIHGGWGDGHLMQARLFTALLTDDGRLLIGAVDGPHLLLAAGSPTAALPPTPGATHK